MATYGLVEYADASPEVRAVYDDIMATRKVDWINNFWKAIAHDPALLKRTWESIKQIMAPGALDPLVKEMIYVAVSVTNGCDYCIASHSASARKNGMTPAMFHELMSVVGMANETNRLAKATRSKSTTPSKPLLSEPPIVRSGRLRQYRYNEGSPMKAYVYVSLKKSVLDPQGKTIHGALKKMGYRGVNDLRQGKYFEIALDDAIAREDAQAEVERIAREVLTNPVIEEYRFTLEA